LRTGPLAQARADQPLESIAIPLPAWPRAARSESAWRATWRPARDPRCQPRSGQARPARGAIGAWGTDTQCSSGPATPRAASAMRPTKFPSVGLSCRA